MTKFDLLIRNSKEAIHSIFNFQKFVVRNKIHITKNIVLNAKLIYLLLNIAFITKYFYDKKFQIKIGYFNFSHDSNDLFKNYACVLKFKKISIVSNHCNKILKQNQYIKILFNITYLK